MDDEGLQSRANDVRFWWNACLALAVSPRDILLLSVQVKMVGNFSEPFGILHLGKEILGGEEFLLGLVRSTKWLQTTFPDKICDSFLGCS